MPAIKVHHTDTDDSTAWDGPAEVAKLAEPVSGAEGRGMFAWYDPEASDDDGDGFPDVKSGYKFPHHLVTDGKPGAASIPGVNNALARLSQADIPTGDDAGVRAHLEAHRVDAGLEDTTQDLADQESVDAQAQRARRPLIRAFEGSAQPYTPFWKFTAAADSQDGETELEFYGLISEYSWLDDSISPALFKDQLYAHGAGGPVTLRINSPGGDPIAASAISAIIASYPGRVTAKIDGQAASAAVMVALAAERVQIRDSAYMMIHDPSVSVFMASLDIGTLTQMRDALKTIKAGLVSAYAARTGLATDRLNRMLTDETWLSAQDAVELGFADEVIPGSQRQDRAPQQFAALLKKFYHHIPAALLTNQAEPTTEETDAQASGPGAELTPTESTQDSQAEPGGSEGTQQDGQGQAARSPYGARVALVAKRISNQGVQIMNLRDLMNQRAQLLAEAQALADLADGEARDFTEEERARFTAIVGNQDTPGELGELDQRITKTTEERERLRSAAEHTISQPEPIKPEQTGPVSITRAQFEALGPKAQRDYLNARGKITD